MDCLDKWDSLFPDSPIINYTDIGRRLVQANDEERKILMKQFVKDMKEGGTEEDNWMLMAEIYGVSLAIQKIDIVLAQLERRK